MDLTLPVNTDEDILKAVTTAYAAARTSNPGETERGKAISAALDGALQAFRSKGGVVLRQGGGAVEVVAQGGAGQTAGDPLAFWEEISKLLHESEEKGYALAKTRSLLASLEGELDETNRGVMALYAELDDRATNCGKPTN